jgi:hypothetical protein
MATRDKQEISNTFGLFRYRTRRTLEIALVTVFAFTGTSEAQSERFCSQTAKTLFAACKASGIDDNLVKKAICLNIADKAQRDQCLNELKTESKEQNQLCQEQRDGRLDACNSLGEGRYDPNFDPALFDDPKNPTHPNPYFPLTVGNSWEYRGGNEVNTLEVVDETKLIAGVGCIVVRDRVFKDGALAENTDDWFCQAKDGNVWYFGEEVKNFESFDGDNPKNPELVKIDGSFKAGRDGDKPGIIFQASPAVGQSYLEEFSLGNAEDVTEILSTTYAFGNNPELDHLVPQLLAERLCSAGDCVVTKNFSLLEPGVFALKYYARGIGSFLEVESTGEAIQLVNCSFDPRCVGLPQP